MSKSHSDTKRFPLAARLGTSASLLTLIAMGAISPVHAQDEEEGEAIFEEEIVVRGMRSSIQSAQELKKASNKIQDSIVAEDIGKLPDRSIAEALQRVPGVSVSRFDEPGDPEHFAGEGAGVYVRGLPQVRAELNGRDIFSASDGRALSFDDVPAELMAGVDVFKSPTADMIEGGLGGIVNLRTRMPFDNDGQVMSATIKGNYGDQISETNFEGSALYSNVWDTHIGKLGILVDLSNSEISSRADNLYVRAYFPRDGISGFEDETIHVSKGADWRRNDYTRVRNGKYLALQLEPTSDLELYLTAFQSRAQRDWFENAFFTGSGDLEVSPALIAGETDWVVDADGVFQSGTVQGFNLGTSSRLSSNRSETTDISTGFEWTNGSWTINLDAQRVLSDAGREDYTVGTVVFPPMVYFGDVNSESGPTIIDVTGELEDLENYSFGQMMTRPAYNNATSDSWRLDVQYDFEDSVVQSVKSGIRYSKKNAINREGFNWSARVQPWNYSWAYTTVPTIDPGSNLMESFSFGEFQRGNADVPVDAWVFTREAVENFRETTDVMVATTVPEADWAQDAVSQPNFDAVALDAPQNMSVQEESSSAAYIMFDLSFTEDFGGNVGVRYVTTENRSHGYLVGPNRQVGTLMPWYFDPVPLYAENDYSHVLPSMNLRYDGIEDFVFRFSAAKGIWKPEFWRLKGYWNFSINDPINTTSEELIERGITDTNGMDGVTMADVNESNYQLLPWRYGLTSNGSNPFLEPMTAIQYDLTAEWYFNENGGMLYAGAFVKDVEDFFRTNYFEFEYDGATWQGDSIVNVGTADVTGFEVGGTYYFDELGLDGFGISANYTYIDSSTEIPVFPSNPLDGSVAKVDPLDVDGDPILVEELEGLAENTFNITLMYENEKFYARLAYNYTGESLQSIGPNGWSDTQATPGWRLPIFADEYAQLDFSVGYNFNDNVSLNFEAYNISESDTKGFMRQNEAGENPAFIYSQDSRYGLSLRVTY